MNLSFGCGEMVSKDKDTGHTYITSEEPFAYISVVVINSSLSIALVGLFQQY